MSFAEKFVPFVRELYETDGFIPLHVPVIRELERKRVLETLETGFVSSVGEHVQELEKRMEAFTGGEHAVAVVNGTAALHTCLILAGVKPGEEVITQSLTFVATCNAISYQHATPVFVDVNRETLGLCPEALREFLETSAEIREDGGCYNRDTGRRIRACVPMHTFGHPVRVEELAAICADWGVALIEDAAESLGSGRKGVHTGNVGVVSAFSFNGNKTITTGGGGVVLTRNHKLADEARHLTTTAKKPHPYLYQHDRVGYNYRMPALNAALGCAQLEGLPAFLANKRETALAYREWFAEAGREFVDQPEGCESNFWLNAFLCEDRAERDGFLQQSNDAGVMARPIWEPMHTLPMFSKAPRGSLTMTEWLADRVVNIPSSVRLHKLL